MRSHCASPRQWPQASPHRMCMANFFRTESTGLGADLMLTILLWLLLLFLCWPLALLALLLYPIVWLIALPFRLLGIAMEGIFEFLRALILLPARIARAIF